MPPEAPRASSGGEEGVVPGQHREVRGRVGEQIDGVQVDAADRVLDPGHHGQLAQPAQRGRAHATARSGTGCCRRPAAPGSAPPAR